MDTLEWLKSEWEREVVNYKNVIKMIEDGILAGDVAQKTLDMAGELMGRAYCDYSVAKGNGKE